jgi:small GTP-binding protein
MSSNGDNPDYENLPHDFSFKMIVIGDAGVGKSCLTGRAIKDKFDVEYSPTVGFEFLTFSTKIDNKIIKLQIWDTCGQEVYRSLITNFYRNSSLAMMVYSINSRESFIHINQWLKEVKIHSHPDVKIILVGNKSDLENERSVTKEEAQKFKDENEILYFEEASAKTGLNAKEVFNEAAKILYEEHKRYKMRATNNNSQQDNNNKAVPTKLKRVEQNRNKGCC